MRTKKLLTFFAVIAAICAMLASCAGVPTETGFRIDTAEMKLELETGEAADFSKLKVEATFDDETVQALQKGEGGYTLDLGGYDKDVAGKYTVTVNYKEYAAKTFVVTVKEPAVPPAETPTVTGIEIKTQPTKTEYEIGEELVLAGMVVQKVMSDGTKVDATEAEYTVDTTAYNKTAAGTYTITVTLNADETKETSVSVTVKAAVPTVTGIEIKTQPTKAEYEIGEELDLSGMVVQKVMSDGTKVDATDAEYAVDTTAYDNTTAGTYAIAVTLKADETKETSFSVTVKAAVPTVTGIEIKTQPTKAEYEIGEELSLSGMVVQKVMSDGTKVDATEAEYAVDTTAYDKTTAGTYTIAVTLKADETKKTSFSVTVKAAVPTVTGIEIKTQPTKAEYEIGEELDLAGMVVQKVMSDGTKVDLDGAEYAVDTTTYDKTTAGTYTITVTLKADETKQTSVSVTVKAAVPAVTYRIKTMPRTAFLKGENFNAFGLSVERTDASGATTLDASDFDVDFSAYDSSRAGKYEIVVNVKEPKTNAPRNAEPAAAVTALPYAVSVSAVQLDLANVKRSYREGEPLDTTNLTVALIDADGKETPLKEETDYFVDPSSYFPWLTGSEIERKIKIVLRAFPDFPLYYEYSMGYAKIASVEIDWTQTSSVLPYGYTYDRENPNGIAKVWWKEIDVNGKSTWGSYPYLESELTHYEVQWDKALDTNVAGTYRLTLGVRSKGEDEPIIPLSLDVTVLEQDAPYATGVSAAESETVTLPYGEEIDYSNFKVKIQYSDGTISEPRTLNETDWIIELRDNGRRLDYQLKRAYKADNKLYGSFTIERSATEFVLDTIELRNSFGDLSSYATKTENNDFKVILRQSGVVYYLNPICYGNSYGKLEITSIDGVPCKPQEEGAKLSEGEFLWDGTETVLEYRVQFYDGSDLEITGKIYVYPDAEYIDPASVLEIKIDGVTQAPIYRLENFGNDESYARGSLSYTIPKGKTELPIRFRFLKNEGGYRFSFRNDTGKRASEGMETTYYYKSADTNSMFVEYSVVSLENGNVILAGRIDFQLETMITSLEYRLTQSETESGEFGVENTTDGNFDVRTSTAPKLEKLTITLRKGYVYKLCDYFGNEVTSESQLGEVLKSQRQELFLKISDEDGVLYETHMIYFYGYSQGNNYYDGYYYEKDETSERAEWVEIYADGQRFDFYKNCYGLEQLKNVTWSLVSTGSGNAVQSAKFGFYDKYGNAINLETVDVLYDTYYLRATYTVYGLRRDWDAETGQEVFSFDEITKTEQWAFRFSSITELPNAYLECFAIAPVPDDMGSNPNNFETSVWAFRTDVVTKDSFGVRFRPEYRGVMRMIVEDAGSDRFLAKFFLEERLVTFLYVDVVRDGIVNADTRADFTYESLTDGKTSFINFNNGEAYLTMRVGSFFNVITSNEYASVSVKEEIPGIETQYLKQRYGVRQIVLVKEGTYNVTVTVASTDGSASEDYVLHINTLPETPLFYVTIAGKKYTAKVSEMMGSEGDFTMQKDFGIIFLRENLKASALGDAFDAERKLLKAAIDAESEVEIYEMDENFELLPDAIGMGEEHAFALRDLSPLGYPEFNGAYGAVLGIYNIESEESYPVLLIVDLEA